MGNPESGSPIGDPGASTAVPAELVLRQLEKLLASPQFSGSERLSAFLKFAVENALANQPDQLKEAIIARKIFGREVYDSNLDSVVRGTARRLREKLDEYYKQASELESVRIAIPKGSYVPIFAWLQASRSSVAEPAPQSRAPRLGVRAAFIAAGVVCLALFGYWLIRHVEQSKSQAKAAAKPAIAILPFRQESGDELLGYSIREDLTTRFAHMQEVRVASRLSDQDLAKDPNVLSWARKFNLTAVLQGKVSTAGDRVEIQIDLTDVRTGYLLWTQAFQGLRGDVPALDRLISEQAAQALGLRKPEHGRLPLSAAYDFYYRGRYLWEQGRAKEAAPLLEQAVAADRNFTLAEVALSESYSSMAQRSLMPPAKVLPMAEQAAKQALDMDPTLNEAHAALGYLRYCQWRWGEADQQFRLATQLAPNYATAWREWAFLDFAYGRFADAERALKQAETLEPGSVQIGDMLAEIYYYWRKYDVAIAYSRSMQQLNHGDYISHMVIADSLLQTRRPQEALAEWRRTNADPPATASVHARVAIYEAANGDSRRLRTLIEELQKPGIYVSPWLIAWYYAHLGDYRSALDYLSRAADERDSDVISVRWDPVFDNVRQEAAYRRVVKKLGF